MPAPAPVMEKPPSFEVASIKPTRKDEGDRDWDSGADRLRIEGYSLRNLIASAYGLKSDSQVLGGPDWIDKRRFDIAAKVDDAEMAKLKSMHGEDFHNEWNLMMQSLLAERFGLKVSPGRRTIPVFALVVAKSGARLAPVAANETGHNLSVHGPHVTATAVSMDALAEYLTQMSETGRVVLNRTGLTGEYDFKMDWTRDRGNGIPPDAPYPGLFTALEEQLGLKLKSQKGDVSVVVVDAASEPAFDN